jgi:hypothetical protein
MTEPVTIGCPACGAKLNLPPEARGRTVRCPKCKQSFQAPAAPAAAPKEVSIYEWQAPPEPAAAPDPSPERTNRRSYAWAWWWGSLFAVSGLVAAGLFGMYVNGYRFTTYYCLIRLAIGLPISTVVFAMSMFVSNWFGAGIELADFGTLIPKALLLVLLANLAGLVLCVGWLVTLGVWFIGAMLFFRLEAWETRFLVAVNWVLGTAMWLVLFRILLGAPGWRG